MKEVIRRTRETNVRVVLDRAPAGGAPAKGSTISTGDPFLDHMLHTLARHAGWSLAVEATSDLPHHLFEDVAIAVGRAALESAPEAIARYGERTLAMDDALVHAVVDCGGRAYYGGRLPSRRFDHWMRSFSDHARLTLHLRVLRGTDRHHVIEAAFKALGLALAEAWRTNDSLLSTKGAVEWEIRPC